MRGVAMKRSGPEGTWIFVLCALGAQILPAAGQSLMCDSADHLCDYHMADGTIIHTPPAGTVLGANVNPSSQQPIHIAFQVHYNTTMVSSLVVKFSDFDYRQATADTCPLPASFGSDPRQNCSQAAVLSTDAANKIQTMVVSVLPASGSSNTNLCFYGVSAADGSALQERCVSIVPIVSASFPATLSTAFVDNVAIPVINRNILALVGNKQGRVENPHVLRIDLSTDPSAATSPGDSVEIELKHDDGITAELPGQQWLGPTFFDNGAWKRSLEYIPTVSQLGEEFPISFQVTTTGAAPVGGTATLNGVACGSVDGRCTADLAPDTTSFTVQVLPFRTAFVPADAAEPLRDPATGELTGELSVPPPESEPVVVYVNCPMERFGISAFAAVGATFGSAAGDVSRQREVQFSIVEEEGEEASLAELGLTLSPTRMYSGSETVICDGGGDAYCQADTNFFHTAAAWTPPLELMGVTRRLCVRAETSTFAAQRCFVIEVQRCYYCTQATDTLHSIAARFDTSWLQLWSVNFDGDGVLNPHEVNPDAIAEGTVLKLGPIYNVRVAENLDHLVREFQTSVEAIRRANRDLAPDAMVVPAQPLCVLPGICTQEEEAWM